VVIFDNGKITRKGTKFRGREKTWIEKDFPIEYLLYLIENPQKAANFYNRVEQDIKNETIDMKKLTATRTVRKNEVSLKELGNPGEKVSYYVTEETGPRGGVKYIKTLNRKYSINYYVKQIKTVKNEIDYMFEKTK
jgi:hypothetical protein